MDFVPLSLHKASFLGFSSIFLNICQKFLNFVRFAPGWEMSGKDRVDGRERVRKYMNSKYDMNLNRNGDGNV